ncbi:MAG: murein biosynthesis integral membrane protein MurJ [candidate division WOR-3 bacterium]|nr:murein biosynthesis integral membrane protein MurJ [candidate division WOR-3 bacterium]MCX7948288.1 murein biosynthesis integral membrane protein MurJ [candidate division WOR-3 bacterium]
MREIVIAYLLGASSKSDAFFVAFRIPNLFRDLLGDQALNNAFIPAYANSNYSRKFLWAIFIQFSLIVLIINIILIIFAKPLLIITAPGFLKDNEKFNLALFLTYITLPSLFFFSISSIFSAVLNTKGKFFITSVAPSIINISIVLFGIFSNFDKEISLSIGFTIGVIVQTILLILFLNEKFEKPDFNNPSIKTFYKLLLPTFLAYGFNEINLFFSTFLASFFQSGAISYLNYAFRIFHFPLAITGIAISTIAIVDFTKSKEPIKDLRRALRMSFFITIPITIFFAVFSEFIVKVLYERGNFTSIDAKITSVVLIIYLISLPFASATKILTSYAFAMKDIKKINTSFVIGTIVDILTMLVFSLFIGFYAIALGNFTSSLLRYMYFLRYYR